MGDCYRRGTEGFKSDVKPNAHFTKNADDFTKATVNQMSSSQYEDLVNKMDKANTSDCVANMSDITSLASQTGQRLYNGKVLGIGKEKKGLYTLENPIKTTMHAMVAENKDGNTRLWHLRLGHASTSVLQHIQSLKHLSDRTVQHNWRSPYEVLHQKILEVSHLRVFGCLCYATRFPKGDKFAPRARKSVFLRGHFPFQTQALPAESDMFEMNNSDLIPTSVNKHIEPVILDTPDTSSDHDTEFSIENNIENVAVPDGTDEANEVDPLPETLLVNPLKTRPSRHTKPPGWLDDYVTNSKPSASCTYPISNYLHYSHLSTPYQAYLGIFSQLIEPTSFREVSTDDRWVKAMSDEIATLESNHT
ncbi:hypothetical protein KY284_026801 [Solanum tuberosum]|nr:hypothetical protein KY284_026801 [Solanum tuberosum]